MSKLGSMLTLPESRQAFALQDLPAFAARKSMAAFVYVVPAAITFLSAVFQLSWMEKGRRRHFVIASVNAQ
jgi:hypothetical protein